MDIDNQESLITKYHDLQAALHSFQLALSRYNHELKKLDLTIQENHELTDMLRDSVIQRFEYCFELTWKYIASYLHIKEQIVPEIIGSRSVFRAACRAHLMTDKETNQALEMVESRNKTSHLYKEEIADTLASLAPTFYELMITLHHRLRPN